ncbi:aspartate 4-decarboxylase [Clostridium magnum]|uniref:Aminotransferase n=1 Tax=Clostridium magnum DSM 2767 TaxID=1121326 RepID=A0A161YG20_9CLOT|nr:aspartate 4-decarboxylase [Clostridium magnum]KZL89062.1 bifunctional aspartate aminotransferase and L-aspartate beta-decarboxylase [Clostridium magnum DSM 2767]SHI30065.1 aspartate 4-decarboxylase [Clostridium magnum DSM 2767]
MENFSVQRKEIEKVYGKISPFELKDKLIDLAEESRKSGAHSLLDAGRGNPNWIAATPREAFFTFGHFAVEESRRVWNDRDLAGMPRKEGISERFLDYVKNNEDAPGIELLSKMINYGVTVKGFNADQWIYELADGIIGDNYPQPDRMLKHIESVVHDYLIQELCYNEPLERKFKIFAVEGATAGMCYIFDSLIANNILAKGDKIALMAPIFTPYLEIPHLPRYNFEVIKVLADEVTEDGERTWQYPQEEIEKLCDPSIKALFIVNPSNPPSRAMKAETVNHLKDIVENHNPNLMIISDDVYGTFVEEFRSLMADLPYNTIGVYSFSKYFGVTGWRLGTIALYEDNIFDKLLREQDIERKERARRRYSGISTNPDKIPFIDRIVADSRQVALNHTAGLSTPQQVQMAFFSLFAIVDRENRYKQLTMDICRRRQRLLFDGLGLKLREDHFDAAYYTQFDLLEWASNNYGDELAKHLQENYKPVDVLLRLAEESSIVLLSGSGFNGPEWSIRISLANLNDQSYSKIGQVLRKILEDYASEWKEMKNV